MSSQEGKIQINSEEVMSSVGILDQLLNVLQGEIQPSVLSNFTALRETGLFSEGLSKLDSQITSIITSNENLMTKLTIHADEIIELEKELAKYADNYQSGYSGGSSGNSGNFSDIADVIVENVNKGVSIKTEDVIASIPKLDEESQVKLIEFLNANKNSDTNLQSLLFDPSKSGLLLTMLKKFYGDTSGTLDATVTDNSYIAQKELLKLFNNSDVKIEGLNDNTILVAKDYLTTIAKENKITLEELIIDKKYDKVLITAVKNLYDGNISQEYNVSTETVNSIRNIVDNIAKENNVTAEEVITNSKYLSQLKGYN